MDTVNNATTGYGPSTFTQSQEEGFFSLTLLVKHLYLLFVVFMVSCAFPVVLYLKEKYMFL